MYKVLIADDEPLIQNGILTMISNTGLELHVIGCVDNGQAAYDMILCEKPDIVLLDIKMPVMDGFELLDALENYMGQKPIFIILTNYDDFQYARRALRMEVFDYLAKVELDQPAVDKVMKSAVARLDASRYEHASNPSVQHNLLNQNTFILKLLTNCFFSENDAELQKMARDLDIPMEAGFYQVLYLDQLERGQRLRNSKGAVQYLYGLIKKMLSAIADCCYVVMWGSQSYAAVLGYNRMETCSGDALLESLRHILEMVRRYASCSYGVGIGTCGSGIGYICVSHSESQIAFGNCSPDNPVMDFLGDRAGNTLNSALLNKNLLVALEAYDGKKAHEIISQTADYFLRNRLSISHMVHVCSNYMHLMLLKVKNKKRLEELLDLHQEDPFSALLEIKHKKQLLDWMEIAGNVLENILEEENLKQRNWLVSAIKEYIQEHYNEKISLGLIAKEFDFNSAYISNLFSKYSDESFSECVARIKVNHAKDLLHKSGVRVQQVSDFLGYSDPYYFSKVFKKIEGISPREYSILCRKEPYSE